MEQLRQQKCVACRADSPHVTDEETAELHPQVADWSIKSDNGVRKLERVFRFSNFAQALAFTGSLGNLAEAEGHHPRLVTEWGRVTATWWTHKIRDLHRNDFIMASKSDELYAEATKGS